MTGTSAQVFSSTGGEQCYTVPAGVAQVKVVAVGAAGETLGSASGGAGATVSATLPVASGATLYVEVGGAGGSGQGGFNGGGSGGATMVMGSPTGGGGGGASDLRTCSMTDSTCNSASSRVLVAGGGGGAGLCGCAMDFGGGPNSFGGPGGNAGSTAQGGTAGSPDGSTPGGGGGGGGTPSSGGAGGAGGQMGANEDGGAGQQAAGGVGGFPNAGGGGGGLFGGGGGGGGSSVYLPAAQGGGGGGGAGSSFIDSSATGGSIGTAASGAQPSVTITAIVPTTTVPVGGGLTLGATIAHKRVTERRRGRVTFLVHNPNSVSTSGRLTATALLARAAAAGTKPVVIGSAKFTAPATATIKVTITLSKKARSYLKTHRRLKARVKLVLSAGGASKVTVEPVVIRASKGKRT